MSIGIFWVLVIALAAFITGLFVGKNNASKVQQAGEAVAKDVSKVEQEVKKQ